MKKILILSLLPFFVVVDVLYFTLKFIVRLPFFYWNELVLMFKAELLILPQDVREVLNMWDIHNLKHNAKYLGQIRNELVFWEIEKQAGFVDRITKEMVDKDEIVMNGIYFAYLDEGFNPVSVNATAVGNLAYIALNAKDHVVKNIAKSKLKEIRMHFDLLLPNVAL
jgi:hypothetical protein